MAGKRRGNAEGSITLYKGKDGKPDRWCGRLTLPDGRRKAIYGATRADVAQRLTKALRDRDQGLRTVGDERQTLAAFLAGWLESKKHSLRSPRTWDRYEELMRLHVVPVIGKVQLARLSPQHIERVQARMLSEVDAHGQPAYSPRTVGHVKTVLHTALEDALRKGLIQRNPTELVDAPHVPHREMQTWTPEQVRTFLATAEGDRLYTLYVLALSTALRQGELFGLRWADVDLERAEFTVTYARQRSKLRGTRLDAEPKTANARRTLPLINTAGLSAVEVLRAHRKRQAAERLAAGPAWQDNGLVFCNTIGGPLDPSNVDRHNFAPIVKRAGVPLIRFHDLRHSAATNLLAAAVPVEVVSRMLGHSDIATTLRFYRHVRRDELHAAAEVMGKLLGG